MITPSDCLIILFAVLTLAAYLLWITERLPRIRLLIGFFAVATLVGAIVLHDLEVADVVSRESTDNTAATTRTDAGRTGS